METLLDSPPAAAPKKPQPVNLKTAHDFTLVTVALALRAVQTLRAHGD